MFAFLRRHSIGRSIAFLLALLCACGRENPQQSGKKVDSEKKDVNATSQPLNASFSLQHGLEKGHCGLAVSNDGKVLVALAPGKSKNVQIWDLDKKQRRHEFNDDLGSILPVAISPDGKTAAIPSQGNRCIKLIDVSTGKMDRELRHKSRVLSTFPRGPYFSPQGDLVIVGSDKEIIGWDVKSGEQKFAWQDSEAIEAASGFFDAGRKFATGYDKLTIKVWDTATGKPIQTMSFPRDDRIFELAASKDATRIASRQATGPIHLWDMKKGQREKQLESPLPALFGNLLFLPDNKTVAYATSDHSIILVNTETNNVSRELRGHAKDVTALALTADGHTLVSSSDDGTVKVWALGNP